MKYLLGCLLSLMMVGAVSAQGLYIQIGPRAPYYQYRQFYWQNQYGLHYRYHYQIYPRLNPLYGPYTYPYLNPYINPYANPYTYPYRR